MFDIKINSALFEDVPQIILLRHAEKSELVSNQNDFERGITEHGRNATLNFAHLLAAAPKKISLIKSSNVVRCRQTAEIFQQVLQTPSIGFSNRLGNPGAYVRDDKIAAQHFETSSTESSVANIIAKLWRGETLAGFHTIKEGTQILLREIEYDLVTNSDTALYISHDAILVPFISYFLSEPLTDTHWIDYLEGFIIRREKHGGLKILFVNHTISIKDANVRKSAHAY